MVILTVKSCRRVRSLTTITQSHFVYLCSDLPLEPLPLKGAIILKKYILKREYTLKRDNILWKAKTKHAKIILLRECPLKFYFICWQPRNSLEFDPISEKTWTKQEILQKTWNKLGMLRYTTFQYYIEAILSKMWTPVILEHLWHLPFGAKIVHTITWRMSFLTRI